jgi:hypothetical protein
MGLIVTEPGPKEKCAGKKESPAHREGGQSADSLSDNTHTHSCQRLNQSAPVPPLILAFSPAAKNAAKAKESPARQRVDQPAS